VTPTSLASSLSLPHCLLLHSGSYVALLGRGSDSSRSGRVSRMGDNKCCPLLEIAPCHDTEEHKHFICPDGPMPDNIWIHCYCMAEWGKREYFKG